MKRLLVFILIWGMVIHSFMMQVAAQPLSQSEIKVLFNGNPLEFDVKPSVKDGRTLVPFRKILEAFGAEVKWDAEQQVVSAKKGSTEMYLKIGIDYAYVNGYEVNLDVAPETLEGRTLVPLRFISESLGAEVGWDEAAGTVAILYNSTVYKLGQAGTYKDITFSIEKVEAQTGNGTLKVSGKINSIPQKLVVEVADDNGYILPGEMKVIKKEGEMYAVETEIYLPSCHNFVGKYLSVKVQNQEQKLIKIAEYEL